jgi:hypothetical protein
MSQFVETLPCQYNKASAAGHPTGKECSDPCANLRLWILSIETLFHVGLNIHVSCEWSGGSYAS